MDLLGRRVLVLGLGRHGGGVAAAKYSQARGARVAVSDQAPAETLAESLAALSTPGLERVCLGGHQPEVVRWAEIVVVNPAVRPENRWVSEARAAGAQITSEVELFLDDCPAPVVAVTGSNGKSTTAAMLAAMAQSAGRRAWLGGNIERSLLGEIDRIRASDVVVLELSSFQLYWLTDDAPWPATAVVTNLTPNHLDWHPNWEHYCQSKRRVVTQAPPGGVCVVNRHDPQLAAWQRSGSVRLLDAWPVDRVPALVVPGAMNQHNAACAAAAAEHLGCTEEAIRRALAGYRGLPHRLEELPSLGGRRIFNDSQATTPESTIAALRTLEGRVWLVVGGADKGSSLEPLAQAIARRAAGAACIGRLGPRLLAAIQAESPQGPATGCENLDQAVAWCWSRSRPGDTLLLSPGAASFDQFRDYADRAEQFRRALTECAGRGAQ